MWLGHKYSTSLSPDPELVSVSCVCSWVVCWCMYTHEYVFIFVKIGMVNCMSPSRLYLHYFSPVVPHSTLFPLSC